MRPGARTPEELETLFEDAFLLRDSAALAELFDAQAVLVAGNGRAAQGTEEINRTLAALWESGGTYLGDARLVVQARDTALVRGDAVIHVVRRGRDHAWRYAISLFGLDREPLSRPRRPLP